jgi:hypothetical protein
MRKNKKGEQKKKKEKLKIQRTLEEQIAKNAEDDKIINQILNQNSSQIQNNNKLYNSFQDNKLENPIRYMNKFDLDYSEINDNYNDNDSQEDSKDSTNELIPSEECAENDNKNKNKKENKKNNKKQKKQKKKKGKFKSTAADFKVKYKTELCKYFEINGYCKYGESCAYAHGVENLRSKVTNTTYYRTKKCVQFFEHGYCPYGNRCQFAHQISTNIINNPYDRKMTYKKTLETISKFENIKNIKELIEKPRLSVFKEIVDNKNPIKSTLLEDIKKIRNEGIIERIIDD